MRTLIKQGHRDALAVLGFAGGDRVEPHDFCVAPQTAAVGGTVHFSLRLVSREKEAVRLVVDYALHRVLANGKKARKVFKLKQVELRPGEAVDLAGKQTFRQLSTRTYYPGPHAIEILANGRSLGTRAFELTLEEAEEWYRGRDVYPQTPPAQDEVIVTFQGVPLGLAKRVGSRLKNSYPRELVRDGKLFAGKV